MFQSCMNYQKKKQIEIETIEKQVLRYVKSVYRTFYVTINQSVNIRTYHFCFEKDNKQTKSKIPCLFIHGWASGLGLFCKSYDFISNCCSDVYAIDLPGFGLSSRFNFSTFSSEIDDQYSTFIYEWLEKMAIEKVIIIGHSFGGYISVVFTLKYSQKIEHLILIDPWGFQSPIVPTRNINKSWLSTIKATLPPINGLSMMRLLNTTIGSYVVSKFRPDIIKNYIDIYGVDDHSIAKYIFKINSLKPTGEIAFRNLCDEQGYAKLHIKRLLLDSSLKMPITFIVGQNSWIPFNYAYEIAEKRKTFNDVCIHVVDHCGHHLYSEDSSTFNELIKDVCNKYI